MYLHVYLPLLENLFCHGQCIGNTFGVSLHVHVLNNKLLCVHFTTQSEQLGSVLVACMTNNNLCSLQKMIGNVEETVRDKIKDITTAINEHLTQVWYLYV